MFFEMPTTVYEEENCVLNHKSDLAALGTRAFIVTGKRSAELCGALDDVKSALESENISYAVFNEIEENPSVETIMKAKGRGLEEGCDFVIGIGGGSPLDAAKAIALMMKHENEGEEYLYTKGNSDSLPIAAIPTTCGTGSEATPYSILTLHKKRTKASISHRIFPRFALVDGKYLAAAPAHIVNNTAMDALGHLFESYINTNATDYSKMLVTAGLGIFQRSREVLEGIREASYADFKNLMNASTIAGMAISHTSTSIPHGLSYSLTYELGVPHGKAVGYFLAGYLKGADSEDRNYVLKGAGFSSIDDFEEFYVKSCGILTPERSVIENGIEKLLPNRAKLKNCPYEVTEDVLKKIAGI